MKSLVVGTLALVTVWVATPAIAHPPATNTLSQRVSSATSSPTIDEAEIAVIVESVATLADQDDFETIESFYADQIRVDYTSLWGGDSQTYTPASLMTAWAAVLPGFDQTYHAISNVQVDLDGDRAIATADVTADHYLEGLYWQVSGQYEYRFIKQAGHWQITHMTFNLTDEVGDRTLVELAAERAATNPVGYLQRQQTEQAVRDFLTSLETKDMDTFATVWAEDAVQEMPFSPEGFPSQIEGRDNLIQHYETWPEISGSANFTNELVFYPMEDPTLVFAEWRGIVEIIPTGRLYEQRYGGLFQVVDGQIKLFREYFNPILLINAFGLDEDNEAGNQ